MTKKSQARVERDITQKELKNTSCWADLQAVNKQCHQLIATVIPLVQLVSQPQIITNVPDINLFTKTVKILDDDLGKLVKELDDIGGLHMSRTGTAGEVNELMDSIRISELYTLWMERHGALIEPSSVTLMEQHDAATAKLRAAQEASNLTAEQDPNVVTDVQINEVKVQDQPA